MKVASTINGAAISGSQEANEAFKKAIIEGRLTFNEAAPNYIGNYMFMGNYNGKDSFKNIQTRKYDV